MSDFIIEDIATETVENPYTGHVDALIEAGEGKQLTIVVDRGTKRDGVTPGDGGKDKLAFQQAANAKGFTARVVKEAVQEDETKVALSFKLTPINKRAKAAATVAAETAPESAPEQPAETVETEQADAPAETDDVAARRNRRR